MDNSILQKKHNKIYYLSTSIQLNYVNKFFYILCMYIIQFFLFYYFLFKFSVILLIYITTIIFLYRILIELIQNHIVFRKKLNTGSSKVQIPLDLPDGSNWPLRRSVWRFAARLSPSVCRVCWCNHTAPPLCHNPTPKLSALCSQKLKNSRVFLITTFIWLFKYIHTL